MKTEFEATFANTNHSLIREKLKSLNAKLIQSEFLQIRANFFLPTAKENTFARVRKEYSKTTLSLKEFSNAKSIHGQKEIEIEVSDFHDTIAFLKNTGFKQKNLQETKRELWQLGECYIMLDTWPFLETFIEIEAENEEIVIQTAHKLGLDYSQAIFDSVDAQYAQKYQITRDEFNLLPELAFQSPNPFIS